jgi:putative tryptophan/tyrosine transport system substrate-binding protein
MHSTAIPRVLRYGTAWLRETVIQRKNPGGLLQALRRRDVIAMLGGAAAAWPLAARAQQSPMPVIGILDPGVVFMFDAFVQGMHDLGYVEGQNISYVRKLAQGQPESIPSLAIELVSLKVDVIVTVATSPIRALQHATTSIPIVFLALGDAVGDGIVSKLARPGGNITGLSWLNDELSAKRLEILRQTIPNIRSVAVFYDPGTSRGSLEATEQSGRTLGLQLQATPLAGVEAYEAAFQQAVAARVDAVDVLASPFFNAHRERFAELAAKYRLPAIYETGEYVRSGCLMAYGPNFLDMGRRGATYVDKILKGANPGDLPVEQPTKFEFVVNLKAAKALGLTIPQSLLARADEVSE